MESLQEISKKEGYDLDKSYIMKLHEKNTPLTFDLFEEWWYMFIIKW